MPKITIPDAVPLAESPPAAVQLPPPKTELGLVIDGSGSMFPWINRLIVGHNNLIADQRTLSGELKVTQVQFSDATQLLYDATPIATVPDLTLTSYRPRGGTALLDGIGQVLELIGNRFDAGPFYYPVLIGILSDGCENASQRFKLPEITGEISFRQQADGWVFLFLAAGQHAYQYALKLGIPPDHIFKIGDADHFSLYLDKFSKAVSRYRLGHADYLLPLGR